MGQQAKSSWQLPLYALLIEEMTGVLPARVQMEALESGEVQSRETGLSMMQTATRRLNKVVESIRGEDWTPQPASQKCEVCPVREACRHRAK